MHHGTFCCANLCRLSLHCIGNHWPAQPEVHCTVVTSAHISNKSSYTPTLIKACSHQSLFTVCSGPMCSLAKSKTQAQLTALSLPLSSTEMMINKPPYDRTTCCSYSGTSCWQQQHYWSPVHCLMCSTSRHDNDAASCATTVHASNSQAHAWDRHTQIQLATLLELIADPGHSDHWLQPIVVMPSSLTKKKQTCW